MFINNLLDKCIAVPESRDKDDEDRHGRALGYDDDV